MMMLLPTIMARRGGAGQSVLRADATANNASMGCLPLDIWVRRADIAVMAR
jgi:hypothetical protein